MENKIPVCDDIIFIVVMYLDLKSIVNLFLTCKYYKFISNEQVVCKYQLQKKLPGFRDYCVTHANYRAIVRELRKNKKNIINVKAIFNRDFEQSGRTRHKKYYSLGNFKKTKLSNETIRIRTSNILYELSTICNVQITKLLLLPENRKKIDIKGIGGMIYTTAIRNSNNKYLKEICNYSITNGGCFKFSLYHLRTILINLKNIDAFKIILNFYSKTNPKYFKDLYIILLKCNEKRRIVDNKIFEYIQLIFDKIACSYKNKNKYNLQLLKETYNNFINLDLCKYVLNYIKKIYQENKKYNEFENICGKNYEFQINNYNQNLFEILSFWNFYYGNIMHSRRLDFRIIDYKNINEYYSEHIKEMREFEKRIVQMEISMIKNHIKFNKLKVIKLPKKLSERNFSKITIILYKLKMKSEAKKI
jgi:hypothetical protein